MCIFIQLRVFSIAIHDAGGALDELNSFLRANRILSVDRHFVQDGANSVWAICVSYLSDETAAGGCLQLLNDCELAQRVRCELAW